MMHHVVVHLPFEAQPQRHALLLNRRPLHCSVTGALAVLVSAVALGLLASAALRGTAGPTQAHAVTSVRPGLADRASGLALGLRAAPPPGVRHAAPLPQPRPALAEGAELPRPGSASSWAPPAVLCAGLLAVLGGALWGFAAREWAMAAATGRGGGENAPATSSERPTKRQRRRRSRSGGPRRSRSPHSLQSELREEAKAAGQTIEEASSAAMAKLQFMQLEGDGLMPRTITSGRIPIKAYTSELEPDCFQQLLCLANSPVPVGHVACMPDVHLGKGATIGSVFASEKYIAPMAVGVDIGCGMVAVPMKVLSHAPLCGSCALLWFCACVRACVRA